MQESRTALNRLRTGKTLFGKSRLNENCVEPFFIATHLETLKCIGKHSQCIWKHWQCSPTELRNVQYRFKIISKHSENVFERWKCIKWNINSLQRETFTKHSNNVNGWVTKTPNCQASPRSIIRQFRATVIDKVIKRLKLHSMRNVWSEESIICSIFSLQVCFI